MLVLLLLVILPKLVLLMGEMCRREEESCERRQRKNPMCPHKKYSSLNCSGATVSVGACYSIPDRLLFTIALLSHHFYLFNLDVSYV